MEMVIMKNKRRNIKPGICIFPRYRWCGPGCSGPGAPINDVDACCKMHDECLTRYGSRSKCKCDQLFINCLKPKVNLSDKGIAAGMMYGYMKMQVLGNCESGKRKNP